MQPSECALAICTIMVGLRLRPEETSARDDGRQWFHRQHSSVAFGFALDPMLIVRRTLREQIVILHRRLLALSGMMRCAGA